MKIAEIGEQTWLAGEGFGVASGGCLVVRGS
jgi:hypothetical protein